MRSKIKICGITRLEDALLAESLGANYIGMIFTKKSPRTILPEHAKAIASKLTNARAVGVFVEQSKDEAMNIANIAGLSVIQHHDIFDSKPLPFIYFHVAQIQDQIDDNIFSHPVPDYIVLDTYSAEKMGGTGKRFDWSMIPTQHLPKIILAGGIGVENIRQALAIKPYAIDLSSSIEFAPGIKDHDKMRRLFQEINNADLA